MAKTLKDILKQAHATIKGDRSSTTDTLSLGKDPGVDYDPKAPAEQEFVAKHSVQKWDDPYDNPDYAAKVKEAPFKKQTKAVYEAKKSEDIQCNRSPKGTECPKHGAGDCMSVHTIKEDEEELTELSSGLYRKAMNRAVMKSTNAGIVGKNKLRDKRLGQAKTFQKAGIAAEKKEKSVQEDVELDEVLTKSTSAGETISDFVHSKNPKFAGKSKEKRKQMALAAYYSKQNEDVAVPLLGSAPPRGDSDEAAEMVKSELKALANKALHLVMSMDDDMHVEPWVQAKIATAKELVSAVHDYMIYRDKDHEEDEQMDTPMTFPNMSVDVNTGRNV
jgi:hypothetical protein